MSLFPVYDVFDITPVSARDVAIYDLQGDEYLDLYGGHAVISIGHSHPHYLKKMKSQLDRMAFYSNSVQNTMQQELGEKLPAISQCPDFSLFLCNSGAEANENALKLASFETGKKGVIAFKNAFHGRTSAAVAATDNHKIVAPINTQHLVDRLDFGDLTGLENLLQQGKHCAVIIECIQGVGGLDEPTTEFLRGVLELCKQYGSLLIADEIQSGFGRTGEFFAFQMHGIQPDIITMAKGMGNGFPVGGVLIHNDIEGVMGRLGTTFGGNHLACVASLAVLEVIENQDLLNHVREVSEYFIEKAKGLKSLKKIKGRGLMMGLEFDFPVAALRKKLVYDHKIFTGSSKNPNLLRILPPLTVKPEHFDRLFDALDKEL